MTVRSLAGINIDKDLHEKMKEFRVETGQPIKFMVRVAVESYMETVRQDIARLDSLDNKVELVR